MRKLGAADAVIDEDPVLVNRPPFLDGVGASVVNLPLDGLRFVGHASLVGALACVDGSNHGWSPVHKRSCGP